MAPQSPQTAVITVNVESGWESLVQPVASDAVLIQQPEDYSLGGIRVNVQQPTVEFIAG